MSQEPVVPQSPYEAIAAITDMDEQTARFVLQTLVNQNDVPFEAFQRVYRGFWHEIVEGREAKLDAARNATMPPPREGRARYSWRDDGRVIYIIEAIPPQFVTVTNDAEAVIQDLVASGVKVDGRRIIYRDTTRHWDGLATSGGKFCGFVRLGHITDEGEAARVALEKTPWAPSPSS